MEKICDLRVFSHPTLKKLIMELKLAFLIIVVSVSNILATPAYSQVARVSLNMENKSLEQVMDEIERQSEFYFVFNQKQIDVHRVVNIREYNKLITDILPDLFKGTNVNYAVFDRKILLTTDPLENNLMAIASGTEQQQNKITGKVTDAATGEAMAGVNIKVKGTTIGVITDGNGKYSIPSAVDQNAVLVFSFIGFVAQEVPVEGKTIIDVALSSEVTSLDEVVVIGYGTRTKRDISGSVTNVSEKSFNQGVNKSALDLIQGKVAGLDIFTGSSDVTSQSKVTLRGISSLSGAVSPFYVIDGIPGMDVNSVAPQDIESITVLKDASSCAIYGSRAASGVILITTKKGKAGQMLVEYSGKAIAGFAADKPPLLSASEYRQYAQKTGIDISAIDKGANTDWFKEITNKNIISHEHNISASGGNEKGNYRASFNYLNNQGIIKGNYMERYNTLFVFNQKGLKDKLDVSFIGGAIKSNSSGINSYGGIYTLLPTSPIKNPDGTWYETYDISQGNVVHSIAENKQLASGYSLYLNPKVNLEIFKSFVMGLNLYTERSGDNTGSYDGITTAEGVNDHGNASRASSTLDRNLLEFTLNYLKSINLHTLEFLAGYSYEESQSRYFSTSVRGFITDEFGFDNLNAADVSKYKSGDISSDGSMSKLIGFFGRLNYIFNDKYIFTATLRRDGSSKFGANHKWGIFPSASVAWRISSEPFMSGMEFLNDLKLRLSYGVTGNQAGISPYNSLALYSTGPLYLNNGNWENTYRYSQNANPDLKWEQTASLNAGLDFSLYKDRINGSIDYYSRLTSDLLYTYPVPVPPYLYATILANVGNISNKGIELVINADILRNQDFLWTVSFNFAHNKQMVTKVSNDKFKVAQTYLGQVSGRGQTGATTSILKEGEEISSFYGLKCLGLDENGMYIIQDVDNNGVIDSKDNQIIGHALPRATYGITNTLSYKGFDLNFFLRGIYGNDIFNNDRMQMGNPTNFPAMVYKEAITTPLRDKMVYNSYYIEKGSFLRLQNVNLGYTFKIKNLNINRWKVYIAGENLFVITKYSGMDPELAAQNSSDLLVQGIDPGQLPPLIRRFILGFNLVF